MRSNIRTIETIIEKDGQRVVLVRSSSGRLLFQKTKEGYIIPDPDTGKIFLIPYETIVLEYLTLWDEEAVQIILKE